MNNKRLVRVKSVNWYETSQKNEDGDVSVPCIFVSPMRYFCGLLCYATDTGGITIWYDNKKYSVYKLEVAWDKYSIPERRSLKKMLLDIGDEEDENTNISNYCWSEMMFDFVNERRIIKI